MSGYENLITYKQGEEIYDPTVKFCQKFLSGRELLCQRDQMTQTARSAKQCIAAQLKEQLLRDTLKCSVLVVVL